MKSELANEILKLENFLIFGIRIDLIKRDKKSSCLSFEEVYFFLFLYYLKTTDLFTIKYPRYKKMYLPNVRTNQLLEQFNRSPSMGTNERNRLSHNA